MTLYTRPAWGSDDADPRSLGDGGPAVPGELTVVAAVARRAAQHPQACAVEDAEGVSYTYAALWERAERATARLRAMGVTPGDVVLVASPRSLDLLPALLGVLGAGASYAALDPAYPRERLGRMAAATGARLLLVHSTAAGPVSAALPHLVSLPIDALLVEGDAPPSVTLVADPLQPAYIAFTSGSTGEPKAVAVPHGALMNLLRGNPAYALRSEDRVLAFAPLGFDPSTFEIWGSLTAGATVVLGPAELPSLRELGRFIRDRRVSVVQLATALMHEVVRTDAPCLANVRLAVVGGDVMSPVQARAALAAMPLSAVLVNGYGPSENSMMSTCYPMRAGTVPDDRVPIGRPLAGTQVVIVDGSGHLSPVGEPGELWVGGANLALGYLGRPDLTAACFVEADPLGTGTMRWYLTGDIVVWRPDGALDFIGRADAQVKVQGFRVELAEVEAVLESVAGISGAAVVALPDPQGDKRLVAILAGPGSAERVSAGRELSRRQLPPYMVPAQWLAIEALPLTAHGKVDRRRLADLALASPADNPAPSTSGDLLGLVLSTWRRRLSQPTLGAQDAVFEHGATSLLCLRVAADLEEALERAVPVSLLFQVSTAAALAARLQTASPAPTSAARLRERAGGPIAITGLAGRFPGAADVAALWRLISRGDDAITWFGAEGLDPLVPEAVRRQPNYVPARGIIAEAECFDARFFEMGPRLAAATDPQHRVFLEVSWDALEDAGLARRRDELEIAVFAGAEAGGYLGTWERTRADIVDALGPAQLHFANEKDYVATTVAHRLDLRGPAVSVQTACSTSLVAVAQAVLALRSGQCDAAIAGGVTVRVPQRSGHLFSEGSMFSPDGTCRPFDAAAAGTSFCDGAAAVVLRPLDAALADGDRVYGIIRGVGIGNDGASKASFTAPSIDGQVRTIRAALADGQIDPATIGYVEAHGTGTPLGDPIEVAALAQTIGAASGRTDACLLGSVKGNVGHMTAAAGVGGLVKVALMLHHRRMVPTAHFATPNPHIDFAASGFRVADSVAPWTAAGPLRAGVSSFGVGGTNAHVIVEEAPAAPIVRPLDAPLLFLCSAADESALGRVATRLADAIEGGVAAGEAATELRLRREPMRWRTAVVALPSESAAALRAPLLPIDSDLGAAPEVALLFTGQGSQTPCMGRGLALWDPEFGARLAAQYAALSKVGGAALVAAVTGEDADRLTATSAAQPALFCLEYALGSYLLDLGLPVTAMLGHSIGEFAAAALAGVFSAEEALYLVVERGRLMEACPAGAMLAVRLGETALRQRLPSSLAVAGLNAASLTVVAGAESDIVAFSALLEADGVAARRLRTSHAFHSPLMGPAAAAFEGVVRQVSRSAPTRPFVSCKTGSWITAAEAVDPGYWAAHILDPVRFLTSVGTLATAPGRVYVEAGPRGTLSALIREPGNGALNRRVVPLMGDRLGGGEEAIDLLTGLGRLWGVGVPARWDRLPGFGTIGASLPGYPFARDRHWVEPGQAVTTSASGEVHALVQAQLELIARQLELLRGTAYAEGTAN